MKGSPFQWPRHRPLVKICGLTRPEDARAAIDLGADLIGLNFWPRSSRHVDRAAAREIVAAAGSQALVVGVFVDASREEIRETCLELGLQLAQLHGEEPPELADGLGAPVLRAFSSFPSMEVFSAWGAARGFLLDAAAGVARGGTGRSWSFAELRELPQDDRPRLIAGGIRPENVREALSASGADGVDVASGVERAPGIKDRERMVRLFEEIRRVAN